MRRVLDNPFSFPLFVRSLWHYCRVLQALGPSQIRSLPDHRSQAPGCRPNLLWIAFPDGCVSARLPFQLVALIFKQCIEHLQN